MYYARVVVVEVVVLNSAKNQLGVKGRREKKKEASESWGEVVSLWSDNPTMNTKGEKEREKIAVGGVVVVVYIFFISIYVEKKKEIKARRKNGERI